MNRFAALLDALLFAPSRNGKLRLMREYFSTAPDPERGWALAALTGELVFDEAKPSQVRALAAARVDPELLGWSYDFVGDLAETVSLIWPAAPGSEGRVPSLSEIVEQLKAANRSEVPGLLEPWLDALDATGRWALLKLVTRELRIGVSARLAKTALAEWSRVELDRIEEIWHGLAPPYQPLFDWLEGRRPPPAIGDLPTFCARGRKTCAACLLPSGGTGSKCGMRGRPAPLSTCRRWCRSPAGMNSANCAMGRASAASRG